MPKIALIKLEEKFLNYDDSEEVIKSITEWEEVTKDELKLLKEYYKRNYWKEYILVLEFVENQKEKIDFAVKSQLEYIKKEKEKEEAEKKAKAEKALARKHKLDLKKQEEKRQLLEQLKKEFGE